MFVVRWVSFSVRTNNGNKNASDEVLSEHVLFVNYAILEPIV